MTTTTTANFAGTTPTRSRLQQAVPPRANPITPQSVSPQPRVITIRLPDDVLDLVPTLPFDMAAYLHG
jgi:hypothetical protein